LQLQRLKRSLSLKSMMRSKSVENFFQRSNIETPLPESIFTTEAPPSIIETPFCDCSLTLDRSPSISPNLSLSSRSPSSSPSLSINSNTPPPPQPRSQKTHCFLEYMFRRPTVCQQCKLMITGNSKQGLRCKTCKIAAHLWCLSELSQQVCNGKSGAFKRNFSSPLLTNEMFTVVKEAPPTQEQGKGTVDPVYEALRYGTSLAQLSRSTFTSIAESPFQQIDRDSKKRFVWREHAVRIVCSTKKTWTYRGKKGRKLLKSCASPGINSPINSSQSITFGRLGLRAIHTYVVLYKFLPQEKNDLELQPGDRVQVIDDSNEDWWKGKSRDKVGFFPANFVQRVRPGERVWKVMEGFHGDREKGQMTVKELQVSCV
ncbi:SH3 and cysteine-rich domain-containing protein isoform X2, partial [Silurus meridionalis]